MSRSTKNEKTAQKIMEKSLNNFGRNFKKNIDITGKDGTPMPDFRKLGMGIQGQIDGLNFIPPEFITPTSLNVVAGGTPVGTIAGVQTLLDGSVYQLPELAATPGFDLEFNFEQVSRIDGLVARIRYDGMAAHDVTLRLYNYDDAQDDEYTKVTNTSSIYDYRMILIPENQKYINDSNQAQIIIVHESAGNNSHDIYIDYIALLGQTITS